jgi:hypothetical protein
MVYTTDTNRLFIGDGETVGGQDVATMLVDGVQAIVDAHIARGVNHIKESNYNELKTDISLGVHHTKTSLQQDLQSLKSLINQEIDFIKKTISQNVVSSTSSDIKNSYDSNYNSSPDFRLTCYKGALDSLVNTEPGDKLFGISFNALHNGNTINAANIQAHWEPTADLNSHSSDSSLVFTVHKNGNAIDIEQLKFDHTGTLSAPSIKTGTYTTEERDGLTPLVGTIIYNSTVNKFQGYQNTNNTTPEWVNLS